VARKGGEVVKVFVDNDRSAFKGNRPDFEQMLAWAKGGKVRGIAVWDTDRLSRNPDRDNLRIIELAERYGVELATVCGEYDLSTSAGRMMFRIVGALARRER
jgi:site-specific DNA recombinase